MDVSEKDLASFECRWPTLEKAEAASIWRRMRMRITLQYVKTPSAPTLATMTQAKIQKRRE